MLLPIGIAALLIAILLLVAGHFFPFGVAVFMRPETGERSYREL
ncbi:hypothetical protein [Bradyrhizobium genosp. A]